MRIDSEELRRRLDSSRNLAQLASSARKDDQRPAYLVPPSAQVTPICGNTSSAATPVTQPVPITPQGTTVEHRIHGDKKGPRRGPIPEEVREVVGTLASLPFKVRPTQEEIGGIFGFDQRQVSQFKTGHIGGHHLPPTEERRATIAARQTQIKDKALQKVMECLDLLTDEKLEDLDAKGLSRVGVDMSKVASAFEEKTDSQNINIVVYTPETRKETSYKTIEV